MSGTDDDAFASADEGDETLTLKQKDKDEGPVDSDAVNSLKKKGTEKSVQQKSKIGADTSKDVASSTESVADGAVKHPGHQTKKSKQKTKKGKNVVKSKENEGEVLKEKEKVKYSETKQIQSASLELSTSKPSVADDEKSEKKLQEVTEKVQKSPQTAEKGSTEMKTPQKAVTVETESFTKECTPTKDSSVKTCTAEETSTRTELLKSPSSQEIVRPMQDSPNEQDSNETKDTGNAEPTKSSSSGGWGWGSWGSSLLDMASSSVTTFTSQVGGGLNAVLETVESTLNIPPPEQFVDDSAEKEKDEKNDSNDVLTDDIQDKSERTEAICTEPKRSDPESVEQPKSTTKAQEPHQMQAASKTSGSGGSWFSSWGVSNITGIVQNTSKSLMTGSLDVLEIIGKKTFDVLKDHDPGLKRARGFLFDRKDKPNLSQILRDAKKEAEFRVEKEKEFEESRKADFGVHFDEFQGLVHLEALEILSQQSERKVQSLLMALPTDSLATIKPTLLLIKQTFETEIEEEEESADEEGSQGQDFIRLVAEHLAELQIGSMPNKVKQTWEEIEVWLAQFHEKKDSDVSSKIVHQTAIQSLARLTSKGIDQFHKTGELILLHMDSDHDYVKKSQSLASLTKILCKEMGCLANKFADCLTGTSEEDRGNEIGCLTTNIYLEASNSSSYVQDGFRLLLPVLQQAAIETSEVLNR
ncbi:hypothetical protein ACJMK2_032701 [Sinanodonta woodiana]|uniref:Protein FAM114A2 n=1 Tax=Sinanodonta woodiana TaxID=1069815 RepID=A0ABD3X2J3_SINWO